MITPIRTLTINELLKRKEDLLISSDDIKVVAKNERNKAIDEFAEVIKQKSETEWVFDLEDEEQYENFLQEIDEIAESMKGEKE